MLSAASSFVSGATILVDHGTLAGSAGLGVQERRRARSTPLVTSGPLVFSGVAILACTATIAGEEERILGPEGACAPRAAIVTRADQRDTE